MSPQDCHGRARTSARGWTLIETLVTVTIIALTLTLGLPALTEVMDRSRLRAASADLEHAARIARSEALKRNATITLQVFNGGWQVQAGNDPEADVLHRGGLEGRVGVTPSSIAFSGSGFTLPTGTRLDLDLAVGIDPASCSETTSTTAFSACRRLQVDAGGAARICDPLRSAQQVGACS